MKSDDPTTVTFRPLVDPRSATSGTARSALRIVWHRDVRRIGQVGLLPAEPISAVDRRSAPFDRVNDIMLSRDPFLSIVQGANGVEIRPGHTRTTVEVNGSPLDAPRTFSAREVKAGVPILLEEEILVCLHQIEVPIERGPLLGLVGDSDAIERVRRQIVSVADLDAPVLVRGETGAGKELVAQAVQRQSKQAGGPFVEVSVADVPRETAASAFFGHARGAFTGASREHPGFFVEANGGTLFLDEIALAPAEVQNMLLRVLDRGEFRPVGSARSRKVSVRLICATDEKLEVAVKEGRFSKPLLERLSRLHIRVPPLRERREDIGVLLLHYLRGELAKIGQADCLDAPSLDGSESPWLGATDVARIARDDLSGNVRSLMNIASRLVASSRGSRHAIFDANVEELLSDSGQSEEVSQRQSGRPAKFTDDEMKRALERHNNNFTAAAADLGINRSTLYDRIGKHTEGIRSASNLSDVEVLASHARHGANLDAMASELGVSRKGLAARLREALTSRKRD